MKKKINRVSLIIGLLVFIVVSVVIISNIFARKELNTKKIKNEDVYIYFGKEKFDYSGNIVLEKDNSITSIKLNNKKISLYSEPIYYKSKKSIILPVAYSVCFPKSSGRQYKVQYYTEIQNVGEDYYLVNRNLNSMVTNNFLFDGKDYYIFLSNVFIHFDNQEIPISSMSYVNYQYDTKDLYIYNFSEDKVYYYENVSTDVLATTDNYTINLSSDSILINNKNKLLMKNFDYLKKLK